MVDAPEDDKIAFVGMACRFSGGATSPTKLWEMLVKGETGWGAVPKSRFNAAAFHHPYGEKTNTVSSLLYSW